MSVLKLLKLRNRSRSDTQAHESERLEVKPKGGKNEPKKRAVIVHGLSGEPNYAWYPWVVKLLEEKGFTVDVPEMPDPDEPQLDAWLKHLEAVIGTPDENLVLIGHSLGSVAVLRYLESLPDDLQVGKVILVAGFTDQIGFREFDNFFKEPLDFEKIKTKSARGFVAIQSSDDPFVTEQYGSRLEEDLDAKLIVKDAAGHMSGPLDDKESCTELPEVVEEATGAPIISMQKRVSRTFRRTVISSAVLLLLFGGAGFGYTYYMDKHNTVNSLKAAEAAASQQLDKSITPGKTSPTTPESVAINLLSSPIARGQTAMLAIQTLAGSTCTVSVTYFGGAVAHDPGLVPKTADDFGAVNWNWAISPAAPIGQGMAKAVCTSVSKKSALVEGTVQVTAN